MIQGSLKHHGTFQTHSIEGTEPFFKCNAHPHKNYIKLQLEPEMNVKFLSPYDATVQLKLASLEQNLLPD